MRSLSPNRLALCALSLAASAAMAAPDAGQLLQELRNNPPPRPAPSASPPLNVEAPAPGAVPEGGARVRVSAFVLRGVQSLPEAGLQALLADAIGRELNLAELNQLAGRLTRAYREAGYLVARAYLPAQEVQGGRVEIAVAEGRLGKVELRNRAELQGDALAPLDLLQPQAALREQDLAPVLLSLRSLPGTRVLSTLRPGDTPGASDLLVEVDEGQAFEADAALDNHGSDSTGDQRLSLNLSFNNPLRLGDQLSLHLLRSQLAQRYAAASYQLPVGPLGTRVGLSASHMDYRLGKQFAALGAYGLASTLSFYARHPLVRSQTDNWNLQLQYDDKRLVDMVASTETRSTHRINLASLSLQGQWQDGWLALPAMSDLSLGLQTGQVHMDAMSDFIDQLSAHTGKGFSKLTASLQRQQQLLPEWTLAMAWRGQRADHNLPSAEKISLGGANGVRAYPEGEASGDDGWVGNLALRWQPAPEWQLQAFADAGVVQVNHQPWSSTGSNRRRLAGAGVGGGLQGSGWALDLSAAWATDREAAVITPKRSPRVWASLSVGY